MTTWWLLLQLLAAAGEAAPPAETQTPTLAQAGAFAQQIYLNELYISHSGTDNFEFIELKTTPGRSLDNIVVLVVE
ncbi:MAG: hypothetical protein RLZZ325_485, partial [Pseudomonadota bacterium]